jgi:hypothetical protein
VHFFIDEALELFESMMANDSADPVKLLGMILPQMTDPVSSKQLMQQVLGNDSAAMIRLQTHMGQALR